MYTDYTMLKFTNNILTENKVLKRMKTVFFTEIYLQCFLALWVTFFLPFLECFMLITMVLEVLLSSHFLCCFKTWTVLSKVILTLIG